MHYKKAKSEDQVHFHDEEKKGNKGHWRECLKNSDLPSMQLSFPECLLKIFGIVYLTPAFPSKF